MFRWIECWLAAGHTYRFVRNIYGDEIVHSGSFKRSEWKCVVCGKRKFRPTLHCEVDRAALAAATQTEKK